ncbi:MAG: hypothetical protein ACOYW7_09695 [Nitrospirota bacterium]
MHEQQHTDSIQERRVHPRQHASGIVTFKTYWGTYEAPDSDHPAGGEWQLPKFSAKVYGQGHLIDECCSGMRIKTSIPLEKGFLVEINQPVPKKATIRWVAQEDSHYHVGLMYI